VRLIEDIEKFKEEYNILLQKKEAKYPVFLSEYSHTMFFRPPVL
jgi:hypothetical protein